MIYRIEVSSKRESVDARGASLCRQAAALGISGISTIRVSDLYFLQGDLAGSAVSRLAEVLIGDPVVDVLTINAVSSLPEDSNDGAVGQSVEVIFLPGVTDSVAESLIEGARMIGVTGLERAATGHRYLIAGEISEVDLGRLAGGLVANPIIQTYSIGAPIVPPFVATQHADSTVETIPLAQAGDAELEAISRERRLSLDLAEMRAIQAYFVREGREPADIELEMLAQTWSEHCVHKTFKALITYEELDRFGSPIQGSQRIIDSLLKTCIRSATEKANKPWVRSAFVDNAGIVAFQDGVDLAFKVETHNHPSALEPFGGANTGVGGVVRDVIGVSARPIANTDALCFGPADLPFSELPSGVLHPRRIADGVTAGVEDYGNKMGIPTVNGAILYDPGYTANPLVFCGCLGVLPHGAHRASARAGDLVVVIGGSTGRDGLRGATFSSQEMTHETGQIAVTAVQIGHPIHEKQTLEAVLKARDQGLYTAITDCGAGGLSSAVGEMAAELGAEIDLTRVPLKYPGLRPWEIWLSEAQERMVLAVPPDCWPRVLAICEGLDIAATDLGTFTGDGRIKLSYDGTVVGELDADFLHNGIPRRELPATWSAPQATEPDPFAFRLNDGCLDADLLSLLATPNIRSKEDVVRRYDHEVQAGTVVKPFVGPGQGPSDAAVLDLRLMTLGFGLADDSAASRPKLESGHRGVVLAMGINPAYGALDPYAMGWAVVDEAMRNCVAVGADPDQLSLLDNFCWGNPNLPDRLGGLVRCAEGCHDAAVAYGAPFISGKDSLNNEYLGADGRKHAIPGTLLISALGILPDVRRSVTMDLKAPGNRLYVVGMTAGELGASAYYQMHGHLGAAVPLPAPHALGTFRALHRAIAGGLVRACHDCSEGGLAVAAAEMALAGNLGLRLRLANVPRVPGLDRDEVIAFSETVARFLVEVAPEDAGAFEACLAGVAVGRAGEVLRESRLELVGTSGRIVVDSDLAALSKAWQGHLR